MSYAIIHHFKGGTREQCEATLPATLPATVTDS
jgi:hypothetical protein